ncbi:30279_t:CDS:2, partial [Gigaspora margarita]
VVMVITTFFEDLSKDFSQLLKSDDYDVIIHSGDKSNFKEFKVQSNIIRARSPYFKTALSNANNWINDSNGFIIFKKPNISPAIFLLILRFDFLAILITSEELILGCKIIQDFIMKLICDEPKPFFESKEFPILDKDIFLTLIKKDVMDIEETDIWKYLIKWGTTQSISYKGKSKETNVNNWGENDFALFKKSLEPFIQYIRFHEISKENFYHYVRPYKKAIPENFYEDLMTYFMANLRIKLNLSPIGSKKELLFLESLFTNLHLPIEQHAMVSDSRKIIGGYNPLGLKNYQQRSNEKYYYEDYDYCKQQWESTND